MWKNLSKNNVKELYVKYSTNMVFLFPSLWKNCEESYWSTTFILLSSCSYGKWWIGVEEGAFAPDEYLNFPPHSCTFISGSITTATTARPLQRRCSRCHPRARRCKSGWKVWRTWHKLLDRVGIVTSCAVGHELLDKARSVTSNVKSVQEPNTILRRQCFFFSYVPATMAVLLPWGGVLHKSWFPILHLWKRVYDVLS